MAVLVRVGDIFGDLTSARENGLNFYHSFRTILAGLIPHAGSVLFKQILT